MSYKILITDEKRGHIIVKAYVSGDALVPLLSKIIEETQKGQIPVGEVIENVEVVEQKREEERPVRLAGGKRACSACGRPGHRRDTCPGKGVAMPEDEELGEPLTRKQYTDVIESRDRDMTSSEIADNMQVSVKEVNAVMSNGTYESYLRKRKETE